MDKLRWFHFSILLFFRSSPLSNYSYLPIKRNPFRVLDACTQFVQLALSFLFILISLCRICTEMKGRDSMLLIILSLICSGAFTVCNTVGPRTNGGLKQNFYRTSCPQAEMIVSRITRNRAQSNSALSAKLLRMHFHDCFVRVCNYYLPCMKLITC